MTASAPLRRRHYYHADANIEYGHSFDTALLLSHIAA